MKHCILLSIKPSRLSLLILFVWQHLTTHAQPTSDTLNRFDAKGKKTGFWTFYLDSTFRECKSPSARYYGYRQYEKGKTFLKKIGRFNNTSEIHYEPVFEQQGPVPIKLNGALVYEHYINRIKLIHLKEEFVNGRLVKVTEFYNSSGMVYPDVGYIFFDSLYKQKPNTSLTYIREENVLVYKQYFDDLKKKALSEKIFLVPHTDFRWLHRPIIGWHGYNDYLDSAKTYDYLELGFSRKYISGTRVDTINQTYKKNKFIYHSVNYSLMGSTAYHHFSLGQKVTYGYNLVLLRAEAGLLNYTDFKATDLSFVFGFGFTVFGYLNEMFYVSLPILTHKLDTYPRWSFSIVIN